VLDNAPSHPPEEDLKSKDGEIVTMYLPPNVTPLIQPMDQNVIRLTKLYYRKSLLASIVANDSNITESLKSLTIKDAIVNLMGAWNRLDSKMIAKCWRNILQVSENNEDEDDLPLSVLRTRYLDNVGPVSEVSDLLNTVLPENTFKEVDVLEWNSIDDQCTNQSDDEDNEVVETEEDRPISATKISPETAINALNTTIQWAECSGISIADVMVLKQLREQAVKQTIEQKKKQTNFLDFFQKI
jgi:hypothetical protein